MLDWPTSDLLNQILLHYLIDYSTVAYLDGQRHQGISLAMPILAGPANFLQKVAQCQINYQFLLDPHHNEYLD